jgi:hypothetical protein
LIADEIPAGIGRTGKLLRPRGHRARQQDTLRFMRTPQRHARAISRMIEAFGAILIKAGQPGGWRNSHEPCLCRSAGPCGSSKGRYKIEAQMPYSHHSRRVEHVSECEAEGH